MGCRSTSYTHRLPKNSGRTTEVQSLDCQLAQGVNREFLPTQAHIIDGMCVCYYTPSLIKNKEHFTNSQCAAYEPYMKHMVGYEVYLNSDQHLSAW